MAIWKNPAESEGVGEGGLPAEFLSRRAFLRSTVGGGIALSAAAWLPSGCASYPQAPEGLKALSPKQAAVLGEIARTIIGRAEGLPDPVDSGTVERLDGLLSQLPGEIQTQFGLLLHFFEHAPPLFGHGFSRFTRMGEEDRGKYLFSWRDSSIRFRQMAFAALKMFVQLAYYAGEKTWDFLGYDGPWVGRIPIDPISPPLAHDPSGPKSTSGFLLETTEETGDLELSCEAVVVGSGAGGSVVAKELSEAGLDVILLEEGGHRPSSSFNQREEVMAPRLYREAGGRATWDLSLPILQGRTLGGSTVHNICLSYGIEPAIVERWRKEAGVVFSSADLAPLQRRVEEHLGVNPIGKWQVNQNNGIFAKGCEHRGVSWEVARHNRVDCLMCGYCDLGCAYDRKQSMLITYIPKAIDAGCRAFTDCKVEKITGGRDKASGVEGSLLDRSTCGSKGKFRIKAKHVVLAASAIDSALLLLRSGIRDEGKLLGNSLHLHPYAAVAGLYDAPVEAWRGIPQSVLSFEYAAFRENGYGGYVMIPGWAHPGMGASVMPGTGKEHAAIMKEYAKTAAGGVMVHDETQGTIGNFPGMEKARISYWPEGEDMKTLLEGVKNLAKIYLASGARKVLLPYADGPFASSDAEVDRIVAEREPVPHKLLLSAVHPQGSCPMGEDPRKSVLDSFGKVHGVEGLYVADGSVFPTSVGTPPTIAIATLASWIAKGISEKRT
ncbi:MAG: GMC family oxidoreductase [Bdellovibrionota bacterium]